MGKLPSENWSPGWQKDPRWSKNATEALIRLACKSDSQLALSYQARELKVNAGPHRKAGEGGGGDARLHISVRRLGGSGWHLILNKTATAVVKVEKRERVAGGF